MRHWWENFTLDGDRQMKVLLVILGACLASFLVIMISLSYQKHTTKIIVDWNSPKFIGERSGYYSAIFGKTPLDEEVDDDVKKAFEEEKEETFAVVKSNAELIKEYGISFKDGTLSDLGIACNTKLFDMCNKYFLVNYNGEQVSPLIPMALANIETPSRADQNITYSSLFPSALVPISSADAIENMSCLAVLESPELFSVLASDHWTRDRGALQMNPNYGVSHESYNSLMGPSEASILANISGAGTDFSGYSAYEPRNSRTLTVNDWLANVATTPGDRFNVRDSILRVASEAQDAINQYASQYPIENDSQEMLIVAMTHNSGSVFNPAYATKKVGNWRSGIDANRYLLQLTSDDFITLMHSYCKQELERARSSGSKITMYLERAQAKDLFRQGQEQGIFQNYESYIYMGNYYEVTYTYPIQALYAYTMLGLVYSGN